MIPEGLNERDFIKNLIGENLDVMKLIAPCNVTHFLKELDSGFKLLEENK